MSRTKVAFLAFTLATSLMRCLAFDAIDPSFAPVIRENGSVHSMAWHATGSFMYVCVTGDEFAGQALSTSLIRVDASGVRDTSYAPVINGKARKVIPLEDGKVLIAGTFTSVDGHPTVNLARLLTDGSVDTTFTVSGVTLPAGIRTMVVDETGAVYVGVGVTVSSRYDPATRKYIVDWPRLIYRLGLTGVFDETFSPTFALTSVSTSSPSSYAIEISTMLKRDGEGLMVGGSFAQVNGVARTGIARFNANGTLDTTFAPVLSTTGVFDVGYTTLSPWVQALVDAGNGRIYVGGMFSRVSGVTRKQLARILGDGTLDSAFAPPITSSVASMFIISDLAVDPSGRLLAAGDFAISFVGERFSRRNLVRLQANGVQSPEFMPDFPKNTQLEMIPGGVFWLSMEGSFWSSGNRIQPISRLTEQGGFDVGFQFDLRAQGATVDELSVMPGRGVLACSSKMREIGGVDTGTLALINYSGQVDPSFQPDVVPSGGPRAALVLPDGRTLIGGTFSTVGGIVRPNLALLEADGTPVPSFDLGGGPNGNVNLLRLMPTGRILVGGSFTAINGNTAPYVALLDLGALSLNPTLIVEEILEARYGSSSVSMDVLPVIQSALSGGMVDIMADATTMGGDPAPNEIKYLTVRFRSNRGERTAKVPSGSRLKLPNPPWETGLIDRSFRPANIENLWLKDAAGLSDGRVLLLSSILSTFAGAPVENLIMLSPTGVLDAGFRPENYFAAGWFSPDKVKVGPGDKIYIGNFSLKTSGGTTPRAIYRLTSSGAVDGSFSCPAFLDDWVYAIEPMPDGGVICAGNFGSTAAGERKQVARLTSSGALDPSFDAGDACDGFIFGIAMEAPDRLWIRGSFEHAQSLPRDSVAMIRLESGVSPQGRVIPQSITVPDGRSVTFGLTQLAGGETCVWLRNGVIIPGATGPTLTIQSDYPCSAATYTARVTNSVGTTESSATLTVREATLEEWLADRGLNGLLTHADSDGDGVGNLEEYLARTDPRSGSSSFQVLSQDMGNTMRLMWQSYPGRNYQVQRSLNLKNWDSYGAGILGDGTMKMIDLPKTGDGIPRFSRIGVTKP